jgi:hypothetical protein
MAIKTYAIPPYRDDFNSNSVQFTGAEGKNYLRILFKPGVSVQVRELNQMQSMLQSQIDKFGRSIYKEGPILEGRGNLDTNVKYIDIELSGDANTIDNINTYTNQISNIKNSAGLKASLLHYEAQAADNTYRFFIRYDSSIQVNGENTQEFVVADAAASVAADVIQLDNPIVDPNDNSENPTQFLNTNSSFATVISTGYGAIGKTDAGVYFINGEFVYNDAEEIYIAKPNEDYTLNGKLAFVVTDTIVTYVDDPVLLDNATGYPNETAPGADRYKIDFQLAFLSDLDDALVANNTAVSFIDNAQSYITLFKTDLDVVVKPARTEYTQLDRKFATRTSEESGDYCLKPFKLDVREYLNDAAGNRGRFTAADITDLDTIEKIDLDGESNVVYGERHYSAGIEPSVAYVQGYRVHLKNKKEIKVEKARDTLNVASATNPAFTTLTLGNYVLGNISDASGTNALPDFSDQSVTYTIAGGGATGTCKVRSLEKVSDDNYRLYIYDVNITAGFLGQATSISTSTTFKFEPLRNSSNNLLSFELLESNNNNLLFPLPHNTVESVTTAHINYKRTFQKSSTTSPQISAGTNEIFESDSFSDYIGINASGADQNCTGISGQSTNTVTLTFDGAVTSIVATVQKSDATHGTKVRKTHTETNTPSSAFTSGSYIDLAKFDIFDIVSITNTTDSEVITSQFTLDNGQRDNFYQDGKITYTGSTDLNGKALSIVYRYFDWTTQNEFFSVDSYGGDEASGVNVEYNEIPTYENLFLADALDFRPYVGTNNSRSSVDPNTVIELNSLNVYLPRYDKVVVSNIGDFDVVKGTPSLNPIVPATPGDSMALHELFVPAYTFDTSDIDIKFIDNRRYTMRDIGTIEKRVKNLEYYTSLSLLEQEATEKKIFTNGGDERFKNGILVDSFIGHNIGNPFDSDYKCAIEPARGILRPSYSTTNVLLGVQSEYRSQETVSLPYTDVPLITQPYASISESVNPFDLAAWLGVVKLDPSMDEWKETRVRPDVIVNSTGSADAVQFLAEESGAIGTKWSEWETDWTGVDSQVENVNIGRSDQGNGATRAANLAAKQAITGSNNWRALRGSITTTTTTTEQAREGIRTTMSFREQQENLGERVVDVSFIPFIRSRRIEIHGQMFKPNTKLYVFFDGVNISDYSSKLSSASSQFNAKSAAAQIHLNENAAAIFTARSITRVELITDASGNIDIQCFIPNNSDIRFKTGERKVTITDSPRNSITDATTYGSATYNATGLIETKETTILSTRIPEFNEERLTAERTLTDIDRNVDVAYVQPPPPPVTWEDPLAQSFIIGEIATGTSVTKLDLFFQKKHASIPVTAHLVTVENGVPTQNIVPFSKVVLNPTTGVTNPDGSAWNFSTDGDEESANYLANVGKRGHIAATVAGDGINGADATYPTTLTFDAPVYLQPGVEYAIVVISNSADYRLWLSETGGDDVNGQGRIDKNPYAGVSFKSQNGSTWTPDQNRDFKFTLYRAQYDTSASRTVTFTGLGTQSSFVISNFVVFSSNVVLPKTGISTSIQFAGASGAGYSIDLNNTEYLTEPVTIANASDIILTAELSTTSEYISPLLDLSRLSLLGISNIINNPTTSAIASSSDSRVEANDARIADGFSYLNDSSTADVQYITRTVALNDPADRLNIYLLGNRPSVNSNIRVLVKLKIDDSEYSDVPWEEIKPTKSIPVNSDGRYSEVEYDFDPEALALFDSNEPRGSLEFTAFAVKIVLTSSDIVNVPTVQDFRAIATFES